MPETVLPPKPSLLAIILITKTRDGTSEFFHYPTRPGANRRRRRTGSTAGATTASEDSSSSGTSSSSDEEDFAAFEDVHSGGGGGGGGGIGGVTGDLPVLAEDDESGSESPRRRADGGGALDGVSGRAGRAGRASSGGGGGGDFLENVDWNGSRPRGSTSSSRVRDGGGSGRASRAEGVGGGDAARSGFMGLPPGFHHLLCPPPSFNKRRFELTIDRLVFLGRPAYARDDGSWRKNRPDKGGRRTRSRHGGYDAGSRTAGSVTTDSVFSGGRIASVTRHMEPVIEQVDASSEDESSAVEATGNESQDGEDETVRSSEAEESKKGKMEKKKKKRKGVDEDDQADAETEPEPAGFEAGYGHEYITGAKEAEKDKTKICGEALNMFNVVFVMNPSPVEYQPRVDDMYKFVVKKFAKALRWEQSRSNFVLKETERLRHLKEKHNSMDSIIKHSPLARAIAEVYTSISASKIAQVDLTPRTSFSVQLPLPGSISVLPSLTEPQLPGIWLTTSNSIASADYLDVDATTSRARLAAHFALLPLASPASIIAEVSASNSPLAPKLAHYLHHTKPTKSFAQIAQYSGIPLADVQFLASHLIYWRRARAVPPLHHRDIYVTSPNADMRRLRTATSNFSRAFPTLPSLPKMLSMLGTAPKQYFSFIPSKDHKEAYMEMLTWLLREGWVTQLRTYAWVRVTAEVRERARQIANAEEKANAERRRKMAALEAQRRREMENQEATSDEDRESQGESGMGTDADSSSVQSSNSQNQDGDNYDMHDGRSHADGSGYQTPMHASMYSTNSADSAETQRTTIPLRGTASSSKAPHSHLSTVETADYNNENNSDNHSDAIRSPTNEDGDMDIGLSASMIRRRTAADNKAAAATTTTTTTTTAADDNEPSRSGGPVLIMSPARASAREMRYLTSIAARMDEEDGRDAREAWETCLKYFNGEHAMERIAVREGWKRKKVEALRARWRSRGILLEVRHW